MHRPTVLMTLAFSRERIRWLIFLMGLPGFLATLPFVVVRQQLQEKPVEKAGVLCDIGVKFIDQFYT